VVLRPAEEGTEMLLTHEGLPEAAMLPHREGWGRMLDRLREEVVPTKGREGG
jgi:hypothetical protein